MNELDQDEEQDDFQQESADPYVYQPNEDEEDDAELDRRIRRSYERLYRLSIIGVPDFNPEALCEDTLTVEGGFDTGYAVNYVDCSKAFGNMPTGATGACCDGNSCSVESQFDCANSGGIYLGDGTTCTPNPCPGGGEQTGACCFSDGTCTVETSDQCDNAGGTYQGDGTSCSPNPCPPPPPCNGCFFGGFLGIAKYLTRTIVMSNFSVNFAGPPFCSNSRQTSSGTATKIETYNTSDCSLSCSCSGSIHVHSIRNCPSDYCDDTISANCTQVNPCSPTASAVTISGCGFDSTTCSTGVALGCAAYGSSSIVVSDTEETITYTFSSGGQTASADVTIMLSDPCI